jgi:hypothetical protein
MQGVLVAYCFGLGICALLGIVLSLVVLHDLDSIAQKLAPPRMGTFLSRTVKIAFILTALIGGISAKFYGCDYSYKDLINNPPALTLKVAGQIEAASRYLLVFLLLLLGIVAVTTTLRIWVGKKDGSPQR